MRCRLPDALATHLSARLGSADQILVGHIHSVPLFCAFLPACHLQVSAPDMKRVTLECGGNDAAIVRADADVQAAAKVSRLKRLF